MKSSIHFQQNIFKWTLVFQSIHKSRYRNQSDQGLFSSYQSEKFAHSIDAIPLSKNDKESSITSTTVTSVHFLSGQLNWLAVISRYGVSFKVCNFDSKIKVCDIIKLNKLVKRIFTGKNQIVFPYNLIFTV